LIDASAAIRRVLALAYLLIWTWQEHLRAAAQRRENPTRRIIFLIDEVEAHLDPAWQRRILPCLLKVVEAMKTATAPHSPLVCVSLEKFFDKQLDRLVDFGRRRIG
jgi:predicted ATP-dependent endonuclease of OLD family